MPRACHRAVESLTQKVRHQRVQRESKTFSSVPCTSWTTAKAGITIRGIYQWVDKKYSMRVVNYGKRLLYDVVVPEPASFLIHALKNAAQPEKFQLTTVDRNLSPSQLNAGNYVLVRCAYTVSPGSVQTAAREFALTVSHRREPAPRSPNTSRRMAPKRI